MVSVRSVKECREEGVTSWIYRWGIERRVKQVVGGRPGGGWLEKLVFINRTAQSPAGVGELEAGAASKNDGHSTT